MKFLLCLGIMLAFVTERALSQHYLLGKFPIQSDGRNFGGLLDPNSVTTRLSSLETSVTPLTSGLAALQNQVAAFPSQVATLQSQISTLQSLPNQVATLLTKLTADEALIAATQANITSLQTQLATAQANTSALQTQLAAAQANTSALQTQLATAQANNTALQTQLATAQSNITALQTQLAAANATANTANATANAATTAAAQAKTDAAAAAAPKCSAALAAIGGKLIGNFCYTLGTTAKPFTAAQTACAANGGTLAEPTPTTVANGLSLYNAIKTDAVTAATSPNLWIGVVKPLTTSTFSFASTGTALAAGDQTAIFETTGGVGTVAITDVATPTAEAATLEPTGKYINELQTATRLYICQNPAV